MGLLSALGSIGGLIGAPFTGGASLALGPLLGGIGDAASVLGKQEQGKAQGKAAQAQLQQGQDRNAVDLYQAQQNAQNQAGQLDLQRKGFDTANRSASAKQALIGALLGGGVTPTSIGPSGASGGLLRSLNGNPDALAALKLLGSQGSTAQTTPLQFQGGTMVAPPTLTPLPAIDNGGVLSALARIGEIGGALSPYIKSKPPQDDSQYGGYSMPGGQY